MLYSITETVSNGKLLPNKCLIYFCFFEKLARLYGALLYLLIGNINVQYSFQQFVCAKNNFNNFKLSICILYYLIHCKLLTIDCTNRFVFIFILVLEKKFELFLFSFLYNIIFYFGCIRLLQKETQLNSQCTHE